MTRTTQTSASSPARTGLPAEPNGWKEPKDMTSIPGVREDVSIVGTGITHVPMVGRPEFTGLLIGADDSAIARIEDGALSIEVADIDMALAWRNAWQHAVAHLVQHRQRKADRS